MQNPFGKSCTLQPAFTLILGNDGTFELAVSVVELGFVVDEALVKISILHNVSFETPIVCVLDCIKEDSIARGWPLKGFMEPMGYRLCRVSCVLGHRINFADMGEVIRTVFL